MQVDLLQVKRNIICPYLHRNNWDYDEPTSFNSFFSFSIMEVMAWYYRRNKRIPYDILCSIISYMGTQKNISQIEISSIQLALRKFIVHGLYSRIDPPIINMEAMLAMGDTVIKYNVPIVTSLESKACIIFCDQSIESREDLLCMYETRFASVWSFYVLNKYPVFYNLSIEDKKIKNIKFTPNQFYIRDNKKFWLNMKDRFLHEKIYPAPISVCKNCSKRELCQIVIQRKNQKSKIML